MGTSADAATRNFQNYGRDDGIPQSQILALAQDETGYLWIGTLGGVARYNGHRFAQYSIADGLASNAIEVLAALPDGGLLIGTRNGYCRYRNDTFDCETPETGFPSSHVYAAVRQGPVLWLGTNDGLVRVEGGDLQVLGRQDGLPTDRVLTIRPDPGGSGLWIGTARGLARFRDGKLEPVWAAELGNRAVRMLLFTDRDFFVGTDRGLFRRGEGIDQGIEPVRDGQLASFNDAVVGPRGDIWFGTNRGAMRLSPGHAGEAEWIKRDDGLLADEVHKLLVDRENTIWFGSDDGLSKLALSPFTAYTERHGLTHPFVRSVTEDTAGRVWLGTKQGVSIFHDGNINRLGLPAPYNRAKIYALSQPPEGGMLIGLASGLLWWRDGAVEQFFTSSDGLPDDYVATMDRAGDTIWLGTRSGLARWRNGQVEPYPVSSAVDETFVLALLHDRKGRLWLGQDNGGVIMVDGDTVEHFGPDEGLTGHTVWGLTEAADGSIWVGTNGAGAFRIHDGQIRHFGKSDGLASNIVWQVLADGRNNIWLYTNDGLDRMKNGEITNYGRSSGLLSFEGSTNAAIEHSSGDLYFGTGRGLIHYRPDAQRPEPEPPPVLIEEAFQTTGQPIRAGAELSHDFRQITLQFAALSYRAESTLRYRYRLKGLSEEWSAPIRQPVVSYGHLAPGDYQFEVVAQNDTGRWSTEPARFPFSVSAPVWQTWWFWLMASLGTIIVVLATASWRVYRLQAIRQDLETEVRERTLELEHTNDKLHRLSITDELTGLYNRRHLLRTLRTEIRRLSRMGPEATLGFILVDLDHFKRVNDEMGHLLGDRVLRDVAHRIRDSVRDSDIVARYGGEEFAIVLPETPPEGVRTLAEKLIRQIAVRPFELASGETLSLTVSAGVSHQGRPDAGTDPDDFIEKLIHAADDALYRAKQNDRNRVEVAAE